MSEFKCHFCPVCNGTGCIAQVPGMGGVNRNINFRLNCDGWEVLRKENPLLFVNYLEKPEDKILSKIAFAPITGAVENIGFENEEDYYSSIFECVHSAGIDFCVGDGFPDEKLKYGIESVKKIRKTERSFKANFFIKPFKKEKLFDHIKMVLPYAKTIGIDIDSYAIKTMENLVPLEKKSAAQLLEVKDFLSGKNIDFALKGIFYSEDIDLLREVKPEIAYISNHGGRVETRIGSTAEFLQNYGKEIHRYSQNLWVDGGVRSSVDVVTALAFGADKVLLGRPFVTAFLKSGKDGIDRKLMELSGFVSL